MLKSFLLISIRHILKKGWVSGLNIFCLSLGGAICIFVYSYLKFENGFDADFDQHPTYRIERHSIAIGGQVTKDALVPTSWASMLEVQPNYDLITTRIIPYSEERNAFFESLDHEGDHKKLHFTNAYFIEPSALKLFPFEWINKLDTVRDSPALFLSRSAAMQVLGTNDLQKPNDLILHAIQNNGLPSPDYQIAGIFEDFPKNSSLTLDVLVLSNTHAHLFNSSGLAYTYVNTQHKLTTEQQTINSELLDDGETMYFRPVTSIHFSTGVSNNPNPTGNKFLLIFLATVGLIIMLLSVTNYTVSSIFGTIERMREVGVRKLLGMRPTHLLSSFLTESFIIHLLSGIFAMAMFQYMVANGLPFMPDQKTIGSGNPLDFRTISSVSFSQAILFTLILFSSSTLLSSLYPALYFNRIRPVYLLKGKLQLLNSSLLKGANSVVKVLIIFQLTSSVLFLSGLMIANQELTAANQRDLRSYDLQVRGIFPGLSGSNNTFKKMATLSLNDLKRRELIRDIKYGNLYRNQIQTQGTIDARSDQESAEVSLTLYVVDHTFWKDSTAFLAGENFHPDFGSDPFHIILNQKALAQLHAGLPQDAIGDSIQSGMGNFKIIGITSDTTTQSVAYVSGFRYRTYLDIALHFDPSINNNKDIYDFIQSAEVNLSTAFPKINLLKRDFQKEQLISQGINIMFLFFSFLALAIAAFGLFNLSSFIVEKRGKEIDIRKLLGAQKLNLISLMSSDLFQLVITASIIAAPIIFLTINFGLNQREHSIELTPLLISIPAMIVLTLALLVAVPKCWQQANSNLSQSLGRR